MRAQPVLWVSWSVVALVTALRAIFAGSLPLTGDEAYYWEWSRRLAAGYTDHPPAVAFAIAAFSWIGRTPFAVRLPFVLCGLGTALAAGGAASRLARDARAGAISALAVTLAPLAVVVFGIATPDGPYAFAWALSLYAAVRAFEERTLLWFALLGVALGFALQARIFGIVLCAGVAAAALDRSYRGIWRRGLWIAFVIAAVVWTPFLWWNAGHHWISFAFALLQRHEPQTMLARPFLLYALSALAFSPGLWIAATIVVGRRPSPLLFWTAAPFSILLILLAFRERVEIYWFLGPYISASVALGCAYVHWSARRQRSNTAWAFAPASILCALVFVAALAPRPAYSALHAAGLRLADGGPFEMFTYKPLAADVSRLIRQRHAVAFTDGYGFSSLLDFYGGAAPAVIGYDAQGEEARGWFTDAAHPQRALFVDKVPLSARPDFQRQLNRACGSVRPGPVLAFPLGVDAPPRRYYTTWCDRVTPNGVATLRWQKSKT